MRIVVIGTSGSGKTTLAERLAAALGCPHVEIDQIDWQAGWRDLKTHDPEQFKARVAEAVAGEAWVLAGNSSRVRDMVWSRATHVVWLDLPRGVVMRRVIARSFGRALFRREIWPGTGNRESFAMWLDPEHPIRWAWSTFDQRRADYESRLAAPRWAHLVVHRLRRPKAVDALLAGVRRRGAEALTGRVRRRRSSSRTAA